MVQTSTAYRIAVDDGDGREDGDGSDGDVTATAAMATTPECQVKFEG